MKKLIMIAAVLLSAGQLVAQQALGDVMGVVVDDKQQPVYQAHVFIDDGMNRYQVKTDTKGKFKIAAIPAGSYMLNIRQLEDTMSHIAVRVPMNGFDNLGEIEFIGGYSQVLKGMIVSADLDRVRLINGNLPVVELTAEQIARSPVKFDIKQMITSMSSDVRQTEDGELVFRGARKGDMIYIIDGVKTRNAGSVPSVSIGRMQLYTGGLPAKYGDTLGGVVVMESKSYFDLYRAWQSAQLKAGKDI
ncbi:MAG: carboxypeptidase regulatory-like domain-containing protein [Crocinitomicaceae bacterium]|nr:carboxypeptidase regulatory-like domain-containing protein [Crocinitomicaceae bacterium]